jgi:hypothetical protein
MKRGSGGGRKAESAAHNYFDYDPVKDKSICKCEIFDILKKASNDCETKLCGIPITGKNSTNLKSHLESKHKEIFKLVKEKDKAIEDLKLLKNSSRRNDSSHSTAVTSHSHSGHLLTQATLDSHVGNGSSTGKKSKQQYYADDSKVNAIKLHSVVKLFARTCLPTYLLDTAAFRDFIAELDPQFKAPGT